MQRPPLLFQGDLPEARPLVAIGAGEVPEGSIVRVTWPTGLFGCLGGQACGTSDSLDCFCAQCCCSPCVRASPRRRPGWRRTCRAGGCTFTQCRGRRRRRAASACRPRLSPLPRGPGKRAAYQRAERIAATPRQRSRAWRATCAPARDYAWASAGCGGRCPCAHARRRSRDVSVVPVVPVLPAS